MDHGHQVVELTALGGAAIDETRAPGRVALQLGETGARAAVTAATTRLRPVCMTALAMILGVLPMALGHGEGGEQNAPLGRTVIGGLLLGTVASLFVVPCMFSVLKRRPAPPADPTPDSAP